MIDAALDAQLREALARATISMLGEPLLAVIREMMNPLVIPESAGFKALKREIEAIGEARGKASALLTVLRVRGLTLDDATDERVQQCKDPEVLSRWISRAVTATSLAEVLGADDAE